MAKTMQHLSDFVFVAMANLTLALPYSSLSRVKTGIKSDTFAALRTAPLQLATLFLEDKAEDIVNFENKGHGASQEKGCVRISVLRVRSGIDQHGRTLVVATREKATHHDRPRGSSPMNDNYCLNVLKAGQLPSSKQCKPLSVASVSQCNLEHSETQKIKCTRKCCKSCTYCKRAFTKERLSPVVNCCQRELK